MIVLNKLDPVNSLLGSVCQKAGEKHFLDMAGPDVTPHTERQVDAKSPRIEKNKEPQAEKQGEAALHKQWERKEGKGKKR